MMTAFTPIISLFLILFGVAGLFNPTLFFFLGATEGILCILIGIIGFLIHRFSSSAMHLFLLFIGIVFSSIAIIGFINFGHITKGLAISHVHTYLYAGIALLSLSILLRNNHS